MKKTIKTIAALLIIGTAFTACKKCETPTPVFSPTLNVVDTTNVDNSSEYTLSYFHGRNFKYVQSATNKYHLKRTGDNSFRKYKINNPGTPTSETFTELVQISPNKWEGVYTGEDQQQGEVVLEVTSLGVLVIVESRKFGATYVSVVWE